MIQGNPTTLSLFDLERHLPAEQEQVFRQSLKEAIRAFCSGPLRTEISQKLGSDELSMAKLYLRFKTDAEVNEPSLRESRRLSASATNNARDQVYAITRLQRPLALKRCMCWLRHLHEEKQGRKLARHVFEEVRGGGTATWFDWSDALPTDDAPANVARSAPPRGEVRWDDFLRKHLKYRDVTIQVRSETTSKAVADSYLGIQSGATRIKRGLPFRIHVDIALPGDGIVFQEVRDEFYALRYANERCTFKHEGEILFPSQATTEPSGYLEENEVRGASDFVVLSVRGKARKTFLDLCNRFRPARPVAERELDELANELQKTPDLVTMRGVSAFFTS